MSEAHSAQLKELKTDFRSAVEHQQIAIHEWGENKYKWEHSSAQLDLTFLNLCLSLKTQSEFE